MENNITIYIPDSEVKQFILFKEHYDVFDMMDKQGVFNIQYGKATLNYASGILQTVSKEEVIYHR